MNRRPRLLLLLVLVALVGLGIGPVRAATLGHGHAPTADFSGYVARDGAELGVGRLPNGARGVCLDTGSTWRWPDHTPPSQLITDPMVGYLTSTWLRRAGKDPVLAAALWWAVGERLNSHPLRVSGHVARMRRETPRIARRITEAHDRLVAGALAWAPPAEGYASMDLTLSRTHVEGIGLRSATGHWVPGLPLTLTVHGGHLASGGTTWHGTTGSAALTVDLEADGPATMSVDVRVTKVPSSRFRLYSPTRDRRQRVAASSGPTSVAAHAEVAFVPAQPELATLISAQIATAGATLVDQVSVSGMSTEHGAGPMDGEWRLIGPVRPDGQGGCAGAIWAGAPVAGAGRFSVTTDGTVTVGATRIPQGGCFTYQEQLLPTAYDLPVPWTAPGLATETAVVGPAQPRVPGHPLVDSGGESDGRADTADRRSPARIRLGAVGLATTLSGVAFRGRSLTPPHAIGTGGLWAQGAPIDALVGTTVAVGHVSDDHDRPGAFKALQRARRGQVVELTSPTGVVTRWRITAIGAVDRDRLPRSIFQQSIARRLVLVTCTDKVNYANGAFHYRKNLIVTAVPA